MPTARLDARQQQVEPELELFVGIALGEVRQRGRRGTAAGRQEGTASNASSGIFACTAVRSRLSPLRAVPAENMAPTSIITTPMM